MVEALITAFKPIVGREHLFEEIVLLPSGNGRYEVTLDGAVIYSKAETGQHTTNEYIIQQIRRHLK